MSATLLVRWRVFPVCAGMSLIYTLTGGPGGNFPRACGDVCGDEPDRHAYMLDFGQIVVYLPRTQFQCVPEKATVSRRWLFIIDG